MLAVYRVALGDLDGGAFRLALPGLLGSVACRFDAQGGRFRLAVLPPLVGAVVFDPPTPSVLEVEPDAAGPSSPSSLRLAVFCQTAAGWLGRFAGFAGVALLGPDGRVGPACGWPLAGDLHVTGHAPPASPAVTPQPDEGGPALLSALLPALVAAASGNSALLLPQETRVSLAAPALVHARSPYAHAAATRGPHVRVETLALDASASKLGLGLRVPDAARFVLQLAVAVASCTLPAPAPAPALALALAPFPDSDPAQGADRLGLREALAAAGAPADVVASLRDLARPALQFGYLSDPDGTEPGRGGTGAGAGRPAKLPRRAPAVPVAASLGARGALGIDLL